MPGKMIKQKTEPTPLAKHKEYLPKSLRNIFVLRFKCIFKDLETNSVSFKRWKDVDRKIKLFDICNKVERK